MGAVMAVPLAILELTLRATGSLAYRAAVVVALGAAFLLTWVNLAVGITGNENNPLNLMFFGVLAVGLVGAVVAGFKSGAMARAMAGAGRRGWRDRGTPGCRFYRRLRPDLAGLRLVVPQGGARAGGGARVNPLNRGSRTRFCGWTAAGQWL